MAGLFRWFLRLFGARMIKSAVTTNGKRPPMLDFGLGIALLRDRRVPITAKGLALLLGAGVTAAVIALELPLEGLIAFLVPFIGLAGDAVLDGLEAIAGPVLFGALFLIRLAPKEVVAQMQAERYAFPMETASVPRPQPHRPPVQSRVR